VWKWCSDWYRPDTYKNLAANQETSANPQGPPDSFDPDEPGMPKRVTRGGSFLCDASYCASYRPALSDGDWRKQLKKPAAENP
jgi:formylglycine-generating enzyme required for sulfatase activity